MNKFAFPYFEWKLLCQPTNYSADDTCIFRGHDMTTSSLTLSSESACSGQSWVTFWLDARVATPTPEANSSSCLCFAAYSVRKGAES